jgi:hypothetical protein
MEDPLYLAKNLLYFSARMMEIGDAFLRLSLRINSAQRDKKENG